MAHGAKGRILCEHGLVRKRPKKHKRKKDLSKIMKRWRVSRQFTVDNSNKDYKSPWQIIKELRTKMNIALARLPPVMLDRMGPDYITRDELSLRGYDVPWYPQNRAKLLCWSPNTTDMDYGKSRNPKMLSVIFNDCMQDFHKGKQMCFELI